MIDSRPEARLCLRAAAQEVPDRIAVVDGDRGITYAELLDLAARVAGGLEAHGLDPDRPLGLVAHTGMSFLACLFALVERGVAVAPVHPRLRPGERHALAHALDLPRVLPPETQAALLRGPPRPWPEGREVDAEAPLARVATSGSTGNPKGVILSRRAFMAAFDAASANLPWQEGDRWLLCLPPAHVGGLSVPLRTLQARRTVVCAPPGSFDPQAFAHLVEQERVTLVSLVPTMLARLLEAGWQPPARLRAVLLGGAGASRALLHRAHDAGVPVLTTYGLTETCGQVATQRPGTPPSPVQGAGPPLPGVQVRVVGGEIQVAGPTLLSGLVGGGTPPWTSDGFLRTGDAGTFDGEGRLHVHGRLDDRIVTGGENVDPLEVEAVLASLPGVRAACVFGAPDATWGQVVAAALVPEPGADPRVGLQDHLDRVFAPHRRPRRVALVHALPTTPSGKVDRRAVARRAAPLLVPW